MESEPPFGDERDREGRRLERLLPELLRRALDMGVGKFADGPENVRAFVQELKLPKELLSVLAAQLEETKHGMSAAVAREVHEFLQRTNLGEQLASALSRLSLEVKTEIRFVPNDAGTKPRVATEVRMGRSSEVSPESPPVRAKDEDVGETTRGR